MAMTGFIPSVAKPAAKVTPCCSAMPTSKNRSGYLRANSVNPVPSGMAAVTATMRLSSFAIWTIDRPKNSVYEATGLLGSMQVPVSISKQPHP